MLPFYNSTVLVRIELTKLTILLRYNKLDDRKYCNSDNSSSLNSENCIYFCRKHSLFLRRNARNWQKTCSVDSWFDFFKRNGRSWSLLEDSLFN